MPTCTDLQGTVDAGEEEVPELFPVLYQGLKNCYRCLHLRVTAENILANLV
jgi:hypothetical protein